MFSGSFLDLAGSGMVLPLIGKSPLLADYGSQEHVHKCSPVIQRKEVWPKKVWPYFSFKQQKDNESMGSKSFDLLDPGVLLQWQISETVAILLIIFIPKPIISKEQIIKG